MLHGGTLNKVRNFEYACERAANIALAKIDPNETERLAALSSLIYDDVFNYPLASDYKKLIDLRPQDNRTNADSASRQYAERFDLRRSINNRQLSIESEEGTRFIRINWRSAGWNSPHTFHTCDSLTSNGTVAIVGTASGLKIQKLYKVSGSASIEFDTATSGDGIQITGMDALDLTDEDEIADLFLWVYLPSAPTSITAIWGNDLTTNYWTGVAQTAQADGTAFKVGWNLIKFSWSAATESGTVAPATIDSFKLTIASSALVNVRVDSILFIVGRNFDAKYYSQYIFKNSAGTWISRPTSDNDTCVLIGTAIEIFLAELLKQCAQQMEGEDSASDINSANRLLNGNPDSPDSVERVGLYAKYRSEYPSQSKKAVSSYFSGPRFRN